MVQALGGRLEKTVLGLTGSFGSGKTTVALMFSQLGAFVVDSDKVAHEALRTGSPIYDDLRRIFPDKSLIANDGFDHKKLAAIVFASEKEREKLELIIHPYVFERLVEEVEQTTKPVVVLEVPLLFESGFDQFCKRVLVVQAPDEIIDQRLRAKGFAQKEITARRQAQMPSAEKKKRAHFVIDNSGDIQQTQREVEKIWKKFHPASKGE